MTVVHNVFTNPATGDQFTWPINHDTEDMGGRSRQITYSGNTKQVGLVRQQGDSIPMQFKYSGTFFDQASIQRMFDFYNLGRSQTIYFTDFSGAMYEVLITEFTPVRKRTVRNSRDFAHAPTWYWTYTITMDVVTVLAGYLLGHVVDA
jgi:hypothetical protein